VLLAGLLAGSLTACASAKPASSTSPPQTVRVMTQNLYLGANLKPLFGASGADLIAQAAAIYAHMKQVNFPERAAKIAALIGRERPDVVGLQEVALWQTLQLGPSGWSPVETTDYLSLLLQDLRAAGTPYRLAAIDTGFSNAAMPLPITVPPTVAATFTDRDAILVRDDMPPSQLATTNPASHSFQAAVAVPIPGQPTHTLPIPRGWSSVDITLGGQPYRFVNTHLEAYATSGCDSHGEPSQATPHTRNQQAAELVTALAKSPLPVVLVGDLNALPSDPCDAMAIFRAAGFVDGWAEAVPGVPAHTAGQTDNLNNTPTRLDHQVDYVLYDHPGSLHSVTASGAVAGGNPQDRTPSGLWPSDHAALALSLHLGRP
jgi:endonuclease/exonuclease/phosphatase family metal-dependent hydrolase